MRQGRTMSLFPTHISLLYKIIAIKKAISVSIEPYSFQHDFPMVPLYEGGVLMLRTSDIPSRGLALVRRPHTIYSSIFVSGNKDAVAIPFQLKRGNYERHFLQGMIRIYTERQTHKIRLTTGVGFGALFFMPKGIALGALSTFVLRRSFWAGSFSISQMHSYSMKLHDLYHDKPIRKVSNTNAKLVQAVAELSISNLFAK
jgi:hypothetical protein